MPCSISKALAVKHGLNLAFSYTILSKAKNLEVLGPLLARHAGFSAEDYAVVASVGAEGYDG